MKKKEKLKERNKGRAVFDMFMCDVWELCEKKLLLWKSGKKKFKEV